MKKLFTEIFSLAAAAIVVVGIFYVYGVVTDETYELKAGEKFQYISGRSMGPKFPEQMVVVDTFATPAIGDVVSFECLVDKCEKSQVVHRLVGIDENGCMLIVGDNQPGSFDTNDYGCLMPDEIKIHGVVISQ